MNNRRVQWVCLWISLTVMLSGCNVTKAIEQPPVPSTAKQEEIQSAKERDMVILFQSLVQMDKKDGLTLSKKQAEEMLPLVRRNSTDGELSQADQQQIVGLLSLGQRSYVDEFQEELLSRKQTLTERKPLEDLTPEQREQMIKDFQTRRQEKEKEHQAASEASAVVAEEEPASPPGTDLTPDVSLEVPDNVEQQLIDLLEGRLHHESGE